MKGYKTLIVRLSPVQITMLMALVTERINLINGKAVLNREAGAL